MQIFEPSLADLQSIASAAEFPNKALIFERECTMVQVLAARRSIEIQENGESLEPLSKEIFSLAEPHLYVQAGAPYGDASPFFVRQGVLERLVAAQHALQRERPQHRFLIFDGFRPQAVQGIKMTLLRLKSVRIGICSIE